MQSSTRNHHDIVTDGIISTIPVKFRLQSYVKHYPQTNFPKFRLDLTLLGAGFRWVCLKSGLRCEWEGGAGGLVFLNINFCDITKVWYHTGKDLYYSVG